MTNEEKQQSVSLVNALESLLVGININIVMLAIGSILYRTSKSLNIPSHKFIDFLKAYNEQLIEHYEENGERE